MTHIDYGPSNVGVSTGGKRMSEVNYKHEVRGDGSKRYMHSAILKSDFGANSFSSASWEILAEIADKVPRSDRHWETVTDSVRESANLEYALSLGMLEAMTDLRLDIQRVEGSENQYEFVAVYCDMDGMEIIRHMPMDFVTIKAPSDYQFPAAMELQEETDDYIILKITKNEDYP